MTPDAIYRSICLIFAKNDPRFAAIRGDSRYIELLNKIGLDDESVARMTLSF